MPIPGLESVPRYAELVYRLLGEDVEFLPPGFQLEEDRIEWSFLKREQLWVALLNAQAAVAGQVAFMQVRNPPGSGRIVTVTDYWAASVVANRQITQFLTTTVRGVTGAAIPFLRDQRNLVPITTGRDPVIVETGTAAAFADAAIALEVTAAGLNLPFPPVVLSPGLGVLLANSTVNEVCSFWMAGRSRVARPEELNP